MMSTSIPQRAVYSVWFLLVPGYAYASDQMGSMNVMLIWATILLGALALIIWMPVAWLTRRMSDPRARLVVRILLPIVCAVVLVAVAVAMIMAK